MKKVLFLKVTDNNAKMRRLCDLASYYFYKGQALLILAPSAEAANYIDQLLWRLPEEGFLPHVIAKESTDESVVITTTLENYNKAQIVLNLSASTIKNEAFSLIYELFDETHPDKRKLSVEHQQEYQMNGYQVQVV